MMYNEFLQIAGQDITFQQYTDVIEPMYNAVENMTKFEFIDFMMPSIKALAKKNVEKKLAERMAQQKVVFISDGTKTPNGCYYMGVYGKLVDTEISIRTGKTTVKVRELTEEEEKEVLKTWDLYLNYTVDYMIADYDKKDGEARDLYGNEVIVKWVKG